jgi:hypothetical protein
MKILKAFVIGMGMLIAVGIALAAYGVARNMHQAPAPAAPAAAAASFTLDVPLAPGSRLTQMETAGDRVLLRVSDPDGEHILVVDPMTGRITGRIVLAAPPK